jgi:Actinobacteria/chloroflexi VLRF1 release factor
MPPAPERYAVPPERLGRWLERWAERHGGVARTALEAEAVTFAGGDGAAVRCEPPFPPLDPAAVGTRDGFAPEVLLAHVERRRTVGVLLVRLGGFAAGIFEGRELRASKVGSRLVHGRHRAGGSSAQRFARRRQGQARGALQAAADTAVAVLAGPAGAGALEAVVLGGDRRALATVLEDGRLADVARLATSRVIDVPDPRLAVLRAAPDRFLLTEIVVRPAPAGDDA